MKIAQNNCLLILLLLACLTSCNPDEEGPALDLNNIYIAGTAVFPQINPQTRMPYMIGFSTDGFAYFRAHAEEYPATYTYSGGNMVVRFFGIEVLFHMSGLQENQPISIFATSDTTSLQINDASLQRKPSINPFLGKMFVGEWHRDETKLDYDLAVLFHPVNQRYGVAGIPPRTIPPRANIDSAMYGDYWLYDNAVMMHEYEGFKDFAVMVDGYMEFVHISTGTPKSYFTGRLLPKN